MSKHQIDDSPSGWRVRRLTWGGTAESVSRETEFLGTNGDRIGNLTWLIHTLAVPICVTIHNTYIFFRFFGEDAGRG